MLYTNVNIAFYTVLKKLIDAVDGYEPGYNEVSRTGDVTTYLLPSSFEFTLDIEHNFPLLETRFVPFKACAVETLWYLTGSSNIQILKDHNVKIWDHWATEDGELGPVYGSQWRSFGGTGIDQIKQALDIAKNTPNSRQNLVSAWHPGFLPDPKKTAQENVQAGKMALPPCHTLFRLRVHPMPGSDKKFISLHLYARSNDVPIGIPYNVASYALLLNMFAKVLGYTPKYLTMTLADPHIYQIFNHVEMAREQLNEFEKNRIRYMNPKVKLHLPEKQDIFDFKPEDIVIENYNPNRDIKYTGVAV